MLLSNIGNKQTYQTGDQKGREKKKHILGSQHGIIFGFGQALVSFWCLGMIYECCNGISCAAFPDFTLGAQRPIRIVCILCESVQNKP